MAIFNGEYACNMDAKGRILLPARIKARMPESSRHEIVLGRGMEPCLIIYTKESYNEEFQRINALDRFNREHRKLQRNFFRGSEDIELDNQGRFRIPQRMAQYAHLRKEVLIVGAGTVLEIWNSELYDEYILDDPDDYSDMAQKHLYGSLSSNDVSPSGTAAGEY